MQLLKDAAFAIRIAVADPDLQVRWEGVIETLRQGGAASVWSENKEALHSADGRESSYVC